MAMNLVRMQGRQLRQKQSEKLVRKQIQGINKTFVIVLRLVL